MFDWLLVGGGLHGSHIALCLGSAQPRASVAIIDPQPTVLTAWQRRADACGMHVLRSPQSHHLGLRSDALRVYARRNGYGSQHALGRYRRPSCALFSAHALATMQAVPRISARVAAIERDGGNWRVHTADGVSQATRNVVLATGPTAPQYPAWGSGLAHVFAPGFAVTTASWSSPAHVVVIGGGISAAQYAIACSQRGHAVTLISRHALRRAEFDSRPCFAGPRCLQPLLRLPEAQRPQALAIARNPATLPGDIYNELTACLASGAIRWLCGDVAALTDNGLCLTSGRRIKTDHIALATGFTSGAEALYEHTAARLKLPLDAHGYAPVDTTLAWAPGLYVSGRPASLQLGPMAGNIHGARLAGRRLAQIAAHDLPATAAIAGAIYEE